MVQQRQYLGTLLNDELKVVVKADGICKKVNQCLIVLRKGFSVDRSMMIILCLIILYYC